MLWAEYIPLHSAPINQYINIIETLTIEGNRLTLNMGDTGAMQLELNPEEFRRWLNDYLEQHGFRSQRGCSGSWNQVIDPPADLFQLPPYPIEPLPHNSAYQDATELEHPLSKEATGTNPNDFDFERWTWVLRRYITDGLFHLVNASQINPIDFANPTMFEGKIGNFLRVLIAEGRAPPFYYDLCAEWNTEDLSNITQGVGKQLQAIADFICGMQEGAEKGKVGIRMGPNEILHIVGRWIFSPYAHPDIMNLSFAETQRGRLV